VTKRLRAAKVVALLVSGVLFGQAIVQGGGEASVAPIIVTGLWFAVSIAYLFQKDEEQAEKPRWITPVLLLVALIGYAFILKYTLVGYVLATAAFFLASARLLSTRKFREVVIRDVSVAIGLSLAIYLLFTKLLGISLPAGVLPL
jgi:putative tricarboxylic transport membrane protein